ncbi:response regulator [Cohnella sp. GCM10020058]|uniref:response regulator n=1 Tax=Cohnella sp. GCM10020058 TaxID=3317330 RepID=UPI003640B623
MYKVMIVDDEPLILKGMHSILDWGRHGLRIEAQAASGEEAAERFLAHPVDIVITDIRMPGISGLKLIETLRSVDPSVKFIVLSGYDDFGYVKEGIKFGIENYLLKPIDVKELSATVEGAVRKLEQEGIRRSRSVEEKQILRNNVLLRWMNRTMPRSELKHRAEIAEIPLNHLSYAVVTGCLFGGEPTGEAYSADIRGELISGILEVVRSLSAEWLPDCLTMELVDPDGDIVLLLSDPAGPLDRAVIQRGLEKIHRRIREQWRAELLFSIGTTANGYADVPESYRRAKEQQGRTPLAGSRFVVDGEQLPPRAQGIANFHDRLGFADLLNKRDLSRLNLWIDDEFGRLKAHANASLADAQEVALELLIQIGKLAGRSSFMELFAHLFRLRSVDRIRMYVREFASETLASLTRAEEDRSPVIRKVMLDIHDRYASELSLKTLGQAYNVHPVYLGQLFKKEIGVGFTDYVTGYRIQIAKEMLVHTDLKASEIAAKVGCLDPNYFYKLFAKFTGSSPTDYRNLIKGTAEG